MNRSISGAPPVWTDWRTLIAWSVVRMNMVYCATVHGEGEVLNGTSASEHVKEIIRVWWEKLRHVLSPMTAAHGEVVSSIFSLSVGLWVLFRPASFHSSEEYRLLMVMPQLSWAVIFLALSVLQFYSVAAKKPSLRLANLLSLSGLWGYLALSCWQANPYSILIPLSLTLSLLSAVGFLCLSWHRLYLDRVHSPCSTSCSWSSPSGISKAPMSPSSIKLLKITSGSEKKLSH